MVKVSDICDAIEAFAPLKAQESFDNCGLLVGNMNTPIRSALICVDITEAVMDEAEELGVGMVVSHHPVIFNPLRSITGSTFVERVVERAIRAGIALYASHTNLDSVPGGLSHRLADILGLENRMVLSHSRDYDPSIGFGVVGELKEPMNAYGFFALVKERLNIKVIRHSAVCRDTISRVAINSGSGASLAGAAKAAMADIYMAAEFKHSDFLAAAGEIIIADIGHFESEYCSIDLLFEIISKKIPTFALHKSKASQNPVNYT
jgi:dinuclear metal center YbgI/SA1388 family protein